MHMWEERADPTNKVMDQLQEARDAIRAANTPQVQRDKHAEAVNQVHLSSNKAMLVQLMREMVHTTAKGVFEA